MNSPVNPFHPPRAEVAESSVAGRPIKGLLLGLLVDIGGSTLAGILFFVAYALALSRQDVSMEETLIRYAAEFPSSLLGYLAIAVGCALSVAGGWVCARVARPQSMSLGFVMAAISTTFGYWYSDGAFPPAVDVVLAAATFMSVSAGFHLGRRSVQAGTAER